MGVWIVQAISSLKSTVSVSTLPITWSLIAVLPRDQLPSFFSHWTKFRAVAGVIRVASAGAKEEHKLRLKSPNGSGSVKLGKL